MIQVEEGLVKGREVAGEGEEVREQEDEGEADGLSTEVGLGERGGISALQAATGRQLPSVL